MVILNHSVIDAQMLAEQIEILKKLYSNSLVLINSSTGIAQPATTKQERIKIAGLINLLSNIKNGL